MENYTTINYKKVVCFILLVLILLAIIAIILFRIFLNHQKSNESISVNFLSTTTLEYDRTKKSESNLSTNKFRKQFSQDNIERTPFVISDKRNLNSSKPMVALTFDDGPRPASTSRILDTLEKYDVVATFFDLGWRVYTYPSIVQRQALLGCEIGSHTYNHKNLNLLSPEELFYEINEASKAFISVLGYDAKFVRPPYGSANEEVVSLINYPLIGWSVDTLDWQSRDANSIIAEINNIENLDGRIILMHSVYETTADAVEILVPLLIENGYQLVTVSEIAKYKHNTELKPGIFYKY